MLYIVLVQKYLYFHSKKREHNGSIAEEIKSFGRKFATVLPFRPDLRATFRIWIDCRESEISPRYNRQWIQKLGQK